MCALMKTPSRLSRTLHSACMVCAAFVVVAAYLAPGAAMASLGGDAATVELDRTHFRAMRMSARTASAPPAYTVQSMQLPGGINVREYVSAAQKVFAVAWDGPRIPDVRQLLGAYYPRYVDSAKAAARGHRPVERQDADLVIRTSGHPRAFRGLAYLPQQVPPGVDPSELQ
ncbi:MAG: DUF2844 domain-containing protein [Gemmatimonadota bacterium]